MKCTEPEVHKKILKFFRALALTSQFKKVIEAEICSSRLTSIIHLRQKILGPHKGIPCNDYMCVSVHQLNMKDRKFIYRTRERKACKQNVTSQLTCDNAIQAPVDWILHENAKNEHV